MARNELTISAFDEETGTYKETTVPADISYPDLLAEFQMFCLGLGFSPDTVGPITYRGMSVPMTWRNTATGETGTIARPRTTGRVIPVR